MSTATGIADWPDALLPRCDKGTGSLGSEVVTVRGGSPRVLRAMVEDLSGEFRKGWYDLTAGIAVFMAPNSAHEFTTDDMRQLVEALCLSCDLAVVSMRSTTAQTADKSQRIDPDESFLIGERATRFLRIQSSEGREAALADLGKQPPDLAIEVEDTNYNPKKVEVSRAIGVRELWELATGSGRRAPRIIDLQAPGGARAVNSSRILTGVRPECLKAAIVESRTIGGLIGFVQQKERGQPVARRLLNVAGIPQSRKRERVSPNPFKPQQP